MGQRSRVRDPGVDEIGASGLDDGAGSDGSMGYPRAKPDHFASMSERPSQNRMHALQLEPRTLALARE
jgi:hypothetical protein